MQVDELGLRSQIGDHGRDVSRIDEDRVAGPLDPRRKSACALKPGIDPRAVYLEDLRFDMSSDELARRARRNRAVQALSRAP